jgi:hypothetical protein
VDVGGDQLAVGLEPARGQQRPRRPQRHVLAALVHLGPDDGAVLDGERVHLRPRPHRAAGRLDGLAAPIEVLRHPHRAAAAVLEHDRLVADRRPAGLDPRHQPVVALAQRRHQRRVGPRRLLDQDVGPRRGPHPAARHRRRATELGRLLDDGDPTAGGGDGGGGGHPGHAGSDDDEVLLLHHDRGRVSRTPSR